MLLEDEILSFSSAITKLLLHLRTNLPFLRIKWKGHCLFRSENLLIKQIKFFRHATDFAIEHHNASLFNEQPIESGHHYVKTMEPRTASGDAYLRLKNVMRWLWHRNCTFDSIVLKVEKMKKKTKEEEQLAPRPSSGFLQNSCQIFSFLAASDVSMHTEASGSSLMEYDTEQTYTDSSQSDEDSYESS